MARKNPEKRKQILDYIEQEYLKKGYPPAVREICRAVGLSSTASVHAHLSKLEEEGFIKRDPSKPRAIEITDKSFFQNKASTVNIPVLGTVAAGEPLLASQNISDYFTLPADILPEEEVFMLNVQGESMKCAGILDKDKVIVKRTPVAENGDMVVAMIDGSATVKYFYKEKGRYRLQPDNPEFKPLITDSVEILGKVIGVIRLY